jgi:hypothetical protein
MGNPKTKASMGCVVGGIDGPSAQNLWALVREQVAVAGAVYVFCSVHKANYSVRFTNYPLSVQSSSRPNKQPRIGIIIKKMFLFVNKVKLHVLACVAFHEMLIMVSEMKCFICIIN